MSQNNNGSRNDQSCFWKYIDNFIYCKLISKPICYILKVKKNLQGVRIKMFVKGRFWTTHCLESNFKLELTCFNLNIEYFFKINCCELFWLVKCSLKRISETLFPCIINDFIVIKSFYNYDYSRLVYVLRFSWICFVCVRDACIVISSVKWMFLWKLAFYYDILCKSHISIY